MHLVGLLTMTSAQKFSLLRIRRHARRDDAVGVAHRLAALDLVDVLHAGTHLAPDGVLPVEPFRILEADEELAVAGIRALGSRHRNRAADVLFRGKLRLELLARAAGAGAMGAAGLGHEAV